MNARPSTRREESAYPKLQHVEAAILIALAHAGRPVKAGYISQMVDPPLPKAWVDNGLAVLSGRYGYGLVARNGRGRWSLTEAGVKLVKGATMGDGTERQMVEGETETSVEVEVGVETGSEPSEGTDAPEEGTQEPKDTDEDGA